METAQLTDLALEPRPGNQGPEHRLLVMHLEPVPAHRHTEEAAAIAGEPGPRRQPGEGLLRRLRLDQVLMSLLDGHMTPQPQALASEPLLQVRHSMPRRPAPTVRPPLAWQPRLLPLAGKRDGVVMWLPRLAPRAVRRRRPLTTTTAHLPPVPLPQRRRRQGQGTRTTTTTRRRRKKEERGREKRKKRWAMSEGVVLLLLCFGGVCGVVMH